MRRWLSIIFVLLFSLPFVVGQVSSDEVSESGDSLRLARAVELTTDGVAELYMGGDVDRALRLFEEAIESDSTYAPAQYSISQLLLSSSPDSAVLHSRVAYLSDTTNHWYLNRYAQSVISAGRYSEARPLFERLIELKPLDLNAYRVLAILYQQEGSVDRAISLLDTAEIRAGVNPYLAALKQQLLLSTNQVDRAISEAQAAVEAAPYMAESRVVLAELYNTLGRDSVALVEYNAAMDIDSTRLETLLSMAGFLQKRGMNREYLNSLRLIVQSDDMTLQGKISLVKETMSNRALYQQERLLVNSVVTALALKHPNNKDVVELRAQHLLSMGMVEEALKVVKGHLGDEPAEVDYYRLVVDIERYLERADSVSLYLGRAIERFPDNRSLKMDLGYIHSMEGRYDEAIELFMQNMEDATDSLKGSIWGTIGDIEHQKMERGLERESRSMDDLSKSERKRALDPTYKSYERSLKLYADNAMVLNNYAYFLSEYGGNLKYALQMSERSNRLVDGSPTFIDTYAWILYRLGRYEEAKTQMRRAVSIDSSNNYEIALHYGEVLWVLGESTMADFYWEKSRQWGATEGMIEKSRRRAESNFERQKGAKKSGVEKGVEQ